MLHRLSAWLNRFFAPEKHHTTIRTEVLSGAAATVAESGAGIAAGGRAGLTSLTTAVLFAARCAFITLG